MPDFVAFARQSKRSEFVAAFPFPFLVATTPFAQARISNKTIGLLDDVSEGDDASAESMDPRAVAFLERRTTVLAIRKMTDTHPDMITIGRMGTNDLVLAHPQISTFHAFFREKDGFTLADAGSRNGTWVSGRLLPPKGAPSPALASGESVRFAQFDFQFLSSTACWDVLRVMPK